MKSFVKRALGNAVIKLPYGAKEAIFDALCANMWAQEAFARLGPKAGITSVTTTGQYGEIRSAVHDLTLFPIYARTGIWAKRTNDLLIDFFANCSGTYIDVGANIGLTTIPVSKNPQVRCIAIEPEPINYGNLRANIALNCPHGNVETHQAAAFDRAATLQFEIATKNLGDHRIRLTDRPGAEAEEKRPVIEVRALPLGSIVGSYTQPLAVKIDTQGAEPFVVAGAREILSHAGLMIIEFGPYPMRRMGGDPNTVIELLRGFRTLSVGIKEQDAGSEIAPDEAIAILMAALQERVNDHEFYMDIVARR